MYINFRRKDYESSNDWFLIFEELAMDIDPETVLHITLTVYNGSLQTDAGDLIVINRDT